MKREENEQCQQVEVVKPLQKRTRKNKADISKASKSSHNTRRRQQPDSSEQYLLPAEIPKSKGTESIVTEGEQNELKKVVIRIPHSLLTNERFVSENIVSIQSEKIMIIVFKQLDSISVHAKYLIGDNVMQVEYVEKAEGEKEAIDVDKVDEQNVQEAYDYVIAVNLWGKYVYLSAFECQNKVIKKIRKDLSSFEESEIIKFKVKQPNSDLFVSLNLRLEERTSDDYNGLINQGNTCYMNSYLQTLYHIPAFRNLVYEAEIQEENKFPATLQELFFHLGRAQKPVSPELLIKSFGWGKRETNVQQDAQQFSCLFFEALQRKLNESAPLKGYRNRTIEGLFKGQLNHYIRCAQVGTVIDNTDFRRENFEEFIDLQLPIYPTLKQSLDAYTSQAHMGGDNKYWTEEHGFQEAFKGVKIAYFPPVLMIQLKRFQYSFEQEHNIKILTSLEYQQQFDFSPWSTTGQKELYELYAVLVHEGARAESGHYYNFAKQGEIWYKFNDQIVQQVNKQKALKYNFGGFHESLEFDAKQMKVQKKLVESKTTAYMLVYIKKQFKEQLMTDQNKLPEWIEKKNQFKLQQQEIKKSRKKFFHNVAFIDWQTKLQGKNCPDMGFMDQFILENSKKIIQKVSKEANVYEWLYSEKFIQTSAEQRKKKQRKISKIVSKSDQEKNNEFGLFIYYASPERQNLIGFNVRQSHKMQDFLKLSTDPNPIILKTPFQVKKEEYLIVVKRFLVEKDQEEVQINFTYETLLSIKKEIKCSDLFALFQEKFKMKSQLNDEEPEQKRVSDKKLSFYIDDWKYGPIQILNNQHTIPNPVPAKNQLLVCVVEELPSDLTVEQLEDFSFRKWYQNKKDTINLIVGEQNGTTDFQIKDVHVNSSLKQLRDLIFDTLLKDRQSDYQSSQNIVLKAKVKKGSKYYTEVSQPQFMTIKDLTKFESRLEFHFSSLSVDSRASKHVLQFYYRWKNLELSEPIKVVLNKNEESQNIVKMIKSNEHILEMLKIDGFIEDDAQLAIFTKDWLVVNEIVTNEGKVIGRGDFNNYLKNVKNPIIIVEGRTTFDLESEPKIQIKEQDADPYVYVLLHHVSQSIQRVGTPRFFKIDRRMELYEFKTKILDLIKDQVFGWEGKIHMCNPFKTRIYLYGKDNKKVIDLTDLESFEEIKRLRIEQKASNPESKRKRSKEIRNSARKESIFQDIKESKLQEIKQIPKQVENIESTSKKDKMQINSEPPAMQQNLNKDNMKIEQDNKSTQKQEDQGENLEQVLDGGDVTKVEGPETIYGVFPKLKVLKVQIIHNYLIKPNIALRLNVDF